MDPVVVASSVALGYRVGVVSAAADPQGSDRAMRATTGSIVYGYDIIPVFDVSSGLTDH